LCCCCHCCCCLLSPVLVYLQTAALAAVWPATSATPAAVGADCQVALLLSSPSNAANACHSSAGKPCRLKMKRSQALLSQPPQLLLLLQKHNQAHLSNGCGCFPPMQHSPYTASCHQCALATAKHAGSPC
jgi:hypothetical protein